MIYTITLNPALDRTLWIKKVRDDVSNRIVEEKSFAGGKSVDVSKVLKNLEVDNIALGFVGGFAGRELEGRLLNEGIETDFVRVSGETRTNIIIHEKETGKQLAFNARGPEIKPEELMQFIEQLERLPCGEVVAIGGSIPLGVSPEIYRKIINLVKKCQVKVVLDVDGEALRQGIKALPNIIKPNIHELSELAGRELKDLDDIVSAARSINQQGVEIVLVSMGAKGHTSRLRRSAVSGGPAQSECGEHHWSRRLVCSRVHLWPGSQEKDLEAVSDLRRGSRDRHYSASGNCSLPER